MYTRKRRGDSVTEFIYAPDRDSYSATSGAWKRAAIAVTGGSIFAQSLVAQESAWLGVVGLGFVFVSVVWSLGSRSRVRQESLLVVRELGVQITAEYADGRKKSTFLDKAKIKAILINEGITMHRVIFYLAFVVEGGDKMVLAFENLQPRLPTLVKIYREARTAIFGEEKGTREADHHRSGIEPEDVSVSAGSVSAESRSAGSAGSGGGNGQYDLGNQSIGRSDLLCGSEWEPVPTPN